MARIRSRTFTTIRTEGGLLPADLLVRVASLDKGIPGLSNSDYHLMNGESFGNKIAESWSRLSTAWRHFAALRAALPEGDNGTTITREKWLLPLFNELGYGRLSGSKAIDIEGRSFPVSHMWGSIPVHLVGVNIPLDRRSAGVKGASGSSPHSLIQEFLNKSPDHLWALISNGLDLRILRDNASLTRQAFVEFDLEAMFSDQVYDDFVVLWMLCHQSRVEAEIVSHAWLEKWTAVASQDGTRALDNLRLSVESAISQLGTGFVEHPQNVLLRESLRNGTLSSQDMYREILRLIYRLIFLFVAEDRNLLHSVDAGHVERSRYLKFYSLTRMRTLAGRRRGGPHPDLWRSMIQVFTGLGTEKGIPSLGLNGLGSFLWSQSACPSLDGSNIANHRLLAAVRHLSFVEDGTEKVLRPIDYRNLGSEELGAIYESLLEQHPVVNTDAGTFELNTAAGNERKTTGSYYTPTSLITELLDSAVNPVLDEAAKKQNPEQAILELSVIDPACGSGHFLIAAAHRIAKRLAAVRTGDEEPSPDAMRSALREVIAQCIHGIDLNPMAVELCKVSLWMESMEPGKALGFLDNRIIRGNGLIGATPELLAAGVPDDAFKALTGDDKAVVSSLKKRNKIAQSGQAVLFGESVHFDLKAVAELFANINLMADTTVESVQVKATRWSELVQSAEYQNAVHAADTWCAAFVAPKVVGQPVITQQEFLTARDNPQDVNPEVRAVVNTMAEQYAFLHPYLAFADVFGRGGFDLVLGNPPWERIKLSEKEFFGSRVPEISKLSGSKRGAAIYALREENPRIWLEYQSSLRKSESEGHFLRASGRFALCGRGDVNTYAVFAELMRDAISSVGRMGIIVPTGIATDDTTKHFFADIVSRRQLANLYDFENAAPVFAGVHRSFKFCLLTLSGTKRPVAEAEFVFFAHHPSDLSDPERRFTLSPDDLALINPNTKTAPIFRTRRDADLTKSVYQRLPVLFREDDPDGNPWEVFYLRLIDFDDHSEILLDSRSHIDALRVYEGKMMHQFDHRWADWRESKLPIGEESATDLEPLHRADASYFSISRYWLLEKNFRQIIEKYDYGLKWFLGYRDVTNVTNERTVIASALPLGPASRNVPVLGVPSSVAGVTLLASFNSFVLDFVARQAVGGSHLTFGIVKQLPILTPQMVSQNAPWATEVLHKWLEARVLELSFSAWDLSGFAEDLGYHGPPFKWDPVRRELLRAELDAAFFHLYGIERDDVDYILETFPIVKRKDEKEYGEYRSKRLILECFDALNAAAASGTEYQTVLDPPPADPSCAHPESTRPDWAKA
jgi:hypothetical protein